MLDRLAIVFRKLKDYSLKLKSFKCSLLQSKMKYLGHVVSKEGSSTDPTIAVCTWPTPNTISELRSFLGLDSYYRRFIKKFASIAKLLYTCTTQLNWSEECNDAFSILKGKLVSAPILGYPDSSEDFIIETGASFKGLGAVLSQKIEGKERVVAYASRDLRWGERNDKNYSAIKLELLTLKWAC